MSEEEATKDFGADNIEVYMREVTPLEVAIYKDNSKMAFMKLITHKKDGHEIVVGIHYFGPAAEEVVGGFAVAMKLGMTK